MFDLEFYKRKKVLVTGHTGFKGSWLCKMLVNAGAEVTGYSLNPPTNPALFEIAGIENEEESEEMLEELIDRFGDPPKSVENLLYIARVKSMAHHLYFTDIAQKGDTLRFTLYEKAKINVAAIPEFTASFDKHVKFTMDAKEPYFTYFLKLNTREKYVEAKDVMETFLQRAGEMLMEK